MQSWMVIIGAIMEWVMPIVLLLCSLLSSITTKAIAQRQTYSTMVV
jgi:CHASE1-domain containing sensor protein